jgi:uncharacterized protein
VKVEGTRTFDAPQETVWEVLNDPARMAKTMPGVESFEVDDDRHWRAKVLVPLGLGGMRLNINFEKTEERRPEYARLFAKGSGVGALVSMDTQFNLSSGDSGTEMRWEADVRIAGQAASMGQRVFQPIVNQQVQNVLTALEQQVVEASRGAAPAASGGESGEEKPEDAGQPAEVTPEADPSEAEGTSGAEEGISPWDEEAYTDEPEGPTRQG